MNVTAAFFKREIFILSVFNLFKTLTFNPSLPSDELPEPVDLGRGCVLPHFLLDDHRSHRLATQFLLVDYPHYHIRPLVGEGGREGRMAGE